MLGAMREIIKARLAPLRYPDYRNFFIAQTLSMVGTWSHDLARAWIVIKATGSAGALGNLSLAISLPCLIFILFAGVLVDRTNVKRLLQVTKSLMGIMALCLAALAEFGDLQVWHLMVFGVIEGVLIAFDSPGFSTLVVRMVPRADFQQAIALNSANFHTSRMLGPLVAGWLMAIHGPSLVFLYDGVTYFLVALILVGVTVKALPNEQKPKTSTGAFDLFEGLRYAFRHPLMRYRLLQLFLTISCMFPVMMAIFRVFIQNKFALSAAEFGEVFSFPALGAMGGALSFAILKPKNPMKALWLGIPLTILASALVPFATELWPSVALMTVTGFALYLTFASLTISIHLEVEERFRGRLSSMIGLGFFAIGPLMSFPWGHLADYIGAPEAIWVASAVLGAGSAILAWQHSKVRARSST